jgi:hypothetical protein
VVPVPPAVGTTNNAEVMGILMDVKNWLTKEKGNPENRQGQNFLNVNFVRGTASPGVGDDGVYRDPWGSPYIVTIDLNYDNACVDGFYSTAAVAEETTTRKPLLGLYKAKAGARDVYECKTDVMVWSLGPDRQASSTKPANLEENKDNIVSWQQ